MLVKTIGSKEAKDHFGDLLKSVQREPISILRNGRPAAVLVSPEDFERMQGRRERLRTLLESIRDEAADNNLTPALLNDLLAHD